MMRWIPTHAPATYGYTTSLPLSHRASPMTDFPQLPPPQKFEPVRDLGSSGVYRRVDRAPNPPRTLENIQLAPYSPPAFVHPDWKGHPNQQAAENFFYQTQAVSQTTGGVSPNLAAARLPQHNAAIRSGEIPLQMVTQLEQLWARSQSGRMSQSQFEQQARNLPGQSPAMMATEASLAHLPGAEQTRALRLQALAESRGTVQGWYRYTAQNMLPTLSLPEPRSVGERLAQGMMLKQRQESAERKLRSVLSNLSDEQINAVLSRGATVLTAGPGTGKTETAFAHLLDHIFNEKLDPRDVVVLSRTHSALNAIYDRVEKAVKAGILPQWDQKQFRTIESYMLSQLYRGKMAGNSAMDKMNMGTMELLGVGNATDVQKKFSNSNMGAIEAAMQQYKASQEAFIRETQGKYGLVPRGQTSPGQLMQKIAAVKGNMLSSQGNNEYQAIMARGEQLYRAGERNDPAVHLWAYETNLIAKRKYDLSNVPGFYEKAASSGYIAPTRAMIVSEFQNMLPDQARALKAGMAPGRGRMAFFEGDMGQKGIPHPYRIDQMLPDIFGSGTRSYSLHGNYRLSHWGASLNRAVNQGTAIQSVGASPLPVSMRNDVGLPPKLVYRPTFNDLNLTAVAQLFRQIGLTRTQMGANVQAGLHPFAGGKLAEPQNYPLIWQMHDERMGRKGQQGFIDALKWKLEEKLGPQLAENIFQQGFSTETPSAATRGKIPLLLTQQSQSRSFQDVMGFVTRVGQWDQAGYETNLNIMTSRAMGRTTLLGAGQNLGQRSYNNAPDFWEAMGIPIPHGAGNLLPRIAESMVTAHGYTGAMPYGWQSVLPNRTSATGMDARSLASSWGQSNPQAMQAFIESSLALMPFYRSGVGDDSALSGNLEQIGFDYNKESGKAILPDGFQDQKDLVTLTRKGESVDMGHVALASQFAQAILANGPGFVGTTPFGSAHSIPENMAAYMELVKKKQDVRALKAFPAEEQMASAAIPEWDMPNKFVRPPSPEGVIPWHHIERGGQDIYLNPAHEPLDMVYDMQTNTWQYPKRERGGYPDQLAVTDAILGIMREPSTRFAGKGLYDLVNSQRKQIAQGNFSPEVVYGLIDAANRLAMHPEVPEKSRGQYSRLGQFLTDYALPFDVDSEQGLPRPNAAMLAHLWKTNPREAAMVSKLLRNKQGEFISVEDANEQIEAISSHMDIDRMVNSPELAARLGITMAASHTAPHVTEMRVMADLLDRSGSGVLDPQAVRTLVDAQGKSHTISEGVGVTLSGLMQRMADMAGNSRVRLSADPAKDARMRQQILEHRANIAQFRQSIFDPGNQEQWGHAMAAIQQMVTGTPPRDNSGWQNSKHTEEEIKAHYAQRGLDQFWAPIHGLFKEGNRTLPRMQDLYRQIGDITNRMQGSGTIRRGDVDKLLGLMGHDPESAQHRGLRALEQAHGFMGDDATMTLQQLAATFHNPETANSPSKNTFMTMTRFPLKQGQRVTFMGGAEGFPGRVASGRHNKQGQLTRSQWDLDTGMSGTVEAWNPNTFFGASVNLGIHRALGMIPDKKTFGQLGHIKDMPYEPLLQFRADKNGFTYPVLHSQLAPEGHPLVEKLLGRSSTPLAQSMGEAAQAVSPLSGFLSTGSPLRLPQHAASLQAVRLAHLNRKIGAILRRGGTSNVGQGVIAAPAALRERVSQAVRFAMAARPPDPLLIRANRTTLASSVRFAPAQDPLLLPQHAASLFRGWGARPPLVTPDVIHMGNPAGVHSLPIPPPPDVSDTAHIPSPDVAVSPIAKQLEDIGHALQFGNEQLGIQKPDPDQLNAMLGHGTQGHRLIVGGPGTGKTDVLTGALTHEITSRKIRPEEIVALSAMNSGKTELSNRIARVRRLLPQQMAGADFADAKTFHALGLDVMNQGMMPEDEDHPAHYPAFEEAGYAGYKGNILWDPSPDDMAGLGYKTPAAQKRYLDQVSMTQFATRHLTEFMGEQQRLSGNTSLKMPSQKEIAGILEHVERIKSNRTDDPNDLYSQHMPAGQDYLARMRAAPGKLPLSPDAGLALLDEQQHALGSPDYNDVLYHAGKQVERHGIHALPEYLRRAKRFAVDEAQDIRQVMLGLLGHTMRAVKGNNPRLYLSMDPQQALIPPAFGGVGPNQVIDAYRRLVPQDSMSRYDLSINHRSDLGAVEWNNSIRGHKFLAGETLSAEQQPDTKELGTYPQFLLARTQPQQYQEMFRESMRRVGVSFGQMKQNVAEGKHPFAGASWPTLPGGQQVLPAEVQTVLTRNQDVDLYHHEAARVLQQELGISHGEAKKVAAHILRSNVSRKQVGKDGEIPDELMQFPVLKHSGVRSFKSLFPQVDATMLGGGDRAHPGGNPSEVEIALMRRDLIGQSRVAHGGQVTFAATNRPFTNRRQLDEYLRPGSSFAPGGGTFDIDGGTPPMLNGKVIPPSAENEFEQVAGRYVPANFASLIKDQASRLLKRGVSPNSPYFPKWLRPLVKGLATQQGSPLPHHPEAVSASTPPPAPQKTGGDEPFPMEQWGPPPSPDDFKPLEEARATLRRQDQQWRARRSVQQTVMQPAVSQAQRDALVASGFAPPPGSSPNPLVPPRFAPHPVPSFIPPLQPNPHFDPSFIEPLQPKQTTINVPVGATVQMNVQGGVQMASGPSASHSTPSPGVHPGPTGAPPPPPAGNIVPPAVPPPGGGAAYPGAGSRQPGAGSGFRGYYSPPARSSSGGSGSGGPTIVDSSPQSQGSGFNPYNNPTLFIARELGRIGSELSYVGASATDHVNAALQQGSDYRHATMQIFSQVPPPALPAGATVQSEFGNAAGSYYLGGATGDSGPFQFTNPNSDISRIQNQIPMYSKAQVATGIQNYLASSGQYYNAGSANSSVDVMGLAAMANMNPADVTAAVTGITGYTNARMQAQTGQAIPGYQNQQTSQLIGLLTRATGGNFTQGNVAPYLTAMQELMPSFTGNSYGSTDSYSAMTSAGTFLQLALNSGQNPANLPQVGQLGAQMAQMGQSPDLRQQYMLAKLYGEQNLTASPQYFQYKYGQTQLTQQIQQMQLGSNLFAPGTGIYQGAQADLAGTGLQGLLGSQGKGLSVQQLQINADNTQIESDKVNFAAASLSLAQGYATFAQQQYQQTQLLGPIGETAAQTGRSAYFNFQNRQMAAGYNPLNADTASTFQPKGPVFGLKNEEFYAGVENQRSMLVLGRSRLTSDAAFQQQMKYLNQQENFYVRELALQNQQREFDKTWSLKDLDMQGRQLAVQGKQLAQQVLQLEFDKANQKIQAANWNTMLGELKLIQQNTIQSMQGQGPIGGRNITPIQLIQQLVAAQKGGKDIHALLQGAGLSPDQIAILQPMISTASKGNLTSMQEQSMIAGDKNLQALLQMMIQSGAFGSQEQQAGQADTGLASGGTQQQWKDLIESTRSLYQTNQALNGTLSGLTPFLQAFGVASKYAGPIAQGLAGLEHLIGIVTAGGGGGGAGGSSSGGGQGGPIPVVPPLLNSLPSSNNANNGSMLGPLPMTTGLPGDQSIMKFWLKFLEDLQARTIKGQQNPVYPHYGIITPHVNAEFHQKMSYGVHQGVDLQAAQGSPFGEFVGGKVVYAGWQPWGGEVDVSIPGGMTERYLHLSQIGVIPGQTLGRGQRIGLTGGGTPQSGLGKWSSGSHLHTQYDWGNINQGVNPWVVWATMGDRNLTSFISAPFAMQNYMGHIPSGLQPVHHLSQGGVAMSPILSTIGEQAPAIPEVVLPLSKLQQVLDNYKKSGTVSGAGGETGASMATKSTTVNVQHLVGTLNLTVQGTGGGAMSDEAQDVLMEQVLTTLSQALAQIENR